MTKYKSKARKYGNLMENCPVCGKSHSTSYSEEGYGYGYGSGYLPDALPGMEKYVRYRPSTTFEGKPSNPVIFHEIPAKEFEKIFLKEYGGVVDILEQRKKDDIELAKKMYKKHGITHFPVLDSSFACYKAVNEIEKKLKGRK